MPSRIEYSPREVEHMSDAEVSKVYSRLRKLARRRALEIRSRGFGEFEVARIFPKLKKIKKKDLRSYLLDVSLYLRDPRTKIKGLEKYVRETIATLHRHGYDFVNKTNLKDFGDFMEWVRDEAISKTYYNPAVMDLYKESRRLGVSQQVLKKKFGSFINDSAGLSDLIETMQGLAIEEGRTRVNSNTIFNALNKKK